MVYLTIIYSKVVAGRSKGKKGCVISIEVLLTTRRR